MNGLTALHVASITGVLSIVTDLIAAGAALGTKNVNDSVCVSGLVEVLLLLILLLQLLFCCTVIRQ